MSEIVDTSHIHGMKTSSFENLFSALNLNVCPRRHQYITMAYGLYMNRHMCFHDVGTGKTISALLLGEVWKARSVLIVCPLSGFAAWKRDIASFFGNNYAILTGSTDDRKYLASKDFKYYIINYEGLKCLYANLIPGEGWIIDRSSVQTFDYVILDEIHRCSAYDSKQTQLCKELSKKALFCAGLTGTLTSGNDYLSVYNEYDSLDPIGNILGRSFFAYRNRYFFKYGFAWNPKKGSVNQILEKIAPITTTFRLRECCDVPERVYEKREVSLSKEQKKIRELLKNKKRVELSGKTLLPIEGSALTSRLKQLSSGFLYLDTKEHIAYRLKTNPKLEAFQDCVDECRGQMLVFHHFVEEGRILEDFCRSKKINFRSIRGETKDPDRQYEEFISDPDIKVMILNISSAKESRDFSVSNVVVFYSNSPSYRERAQCIGRIERSGQVEHCVIIDIIAKGSPDIAILRALENGEDAFESLQQYIREFHRS